ncbi:MAG: M23 family metallopeptidase [Acidimicrobiaceae bacterium]|nr:M23 family metallopeptidase [Acidimicrobiaceae bacterium]
MRGRPQLRTSGRSPSSSGSSRAPSLRRSFVAVALSVALASPTAVPQPAEAADLLFRQPTSAPVLDPFRLNDGEYGPGNRGIEYDTGELDRIVAAARGTVVFAGPVAGSLFVTVDHGDGLKSTYGFVGHILVREGREVADGDLVALSDGPFHFSVRLHGEYVDPESLFGSRRVVVRLVPHPFQGRRIQPHR